MNKTRKIVKLLMVATIISIYFLVIPHLNKIRAEECSPWGCKCSSPDLACIRTGFGKYMCLPPKQEAYDCNPTLLPHGSGNCNECAEDLECKSVLFGAKLCVAKGASVGSYQCSPYTQEPCKSEGLGGCKRVSWAHYECSLDAAAKETCENMPKECDSCIKGGGVWTALGCIPANSLNEFIRWALSKIVFVASGIAFLLMVFGAIQILTSAGNPEKVKAGSELITSALSGLIFIILSFFLLKLIGVDILQIPGLGQ